MKPRVAIACSGLGHVRRGNEAWASAVAEGLAAAGMPVTLFGGGPLAPACPYVQVGNWRRDLPVVRHCLPWHYRYLLEQYTFERGCVRRLLKHPHPIVHVADPALALRLHRNARKLGARLVYKDGLLLGPAWCAKFDWVQVLAPCYRDAAIAAGVPVEHWHVIPHLVDTVHFAPAADKSGARARLPGASIPAGALMILAVGDFSPESHKRLDWVVKEVAAGSSETEVCLLLAGHAAGASAAKFAAKTRARLGSRVRLFENVDPKQMPLLYQAADVFAHAALREPFGIVFLEAMASGLPVVAHAYPATQWIVGAGGVTIDMTTPGTLGEVLRRWQQKPAERGQFGAAARARALETFTRDRIIPLYEALYRQIVES